MAETEQGNRSAMPQEVDSHHGNSVAAWTAVAIMLLGFLVMSVAVAVTTVWVFVVGAVIVVVGAITGKVLSGMGLGASGHTDVH